MRVKLKRGWSKSYPELTVGNVYRVLGIEADDLRIISDAGEPILFHPNAFEYVDATRPQDWIEERGEDADRRDRCDPELGVAQIGRDELENIWNKA